jgi:CheY-specific phosphatase CheX
MSQGASASDWLQAVVDSSDEFATSMLGLSGAKIIEISGTLPQSESAAYIALVGEKTAIQVGLSATPDNSQLLAKALMGMEPEEEDLETAEVADAFSEIANILAGQVKTKMADAQDPVNLGLPMFIRGDLSIPENTEVSIAKATMGDIPVTLLVLKNN